MADTKISALTAASAAAAANEIPINEAGTSKKLTVSLLRDFMGDQKAIVTTLHTNSTATCTVVTDLIMALVAGTYRFSYWLRVQGDTAGTGIGFAVNYTGTATHIVYSLKWPDTGTTASLGAIDDTANAAAGQVWAHSTSRAEGTTTATVSSGTAGVASTTVNLWCMVEGILVAGDAGNLELYHGSETTTATRVETGSTLMVTRFA